MDYHGWAQLALSRFHIPNLKPEQALVAEAALNGRSDLFVVLPTGYGKSLTYQLPALFQWTQQGKATIVLCPTISLMEDQVRHLSSWGIDSIAKHSLSGITITDILEGLQKKKWVLLYCTPEWFINHVKALKMAYTEGWVADLLVFDEVHLVKEWGMTFRHAFTEVGLARAEFPALRLMMVSGSVSRLTVDELHRAIVGNRQCQYVIGDPVRDNLVYRCETSLRFNSDRLISEYKSGTIATPSVVFCSTIAEVERITKKFANFGLRSACYHGQITSRKQRKTAADRFINNEIDVMVCTSAFGLGIDKPDIRSVIHLQPPLSFEQYYQESGRGGRDGALCTALMVLPLSWTIQHHLLSGSYPTLDTLQRFVEVVHKHVDKNNETVVKDHRYFEATNGRYPCSHEICAEAAIDSMTFAALREVTSYYHLIEWERYRDEWLTVEVKKEHTRRNDAVYKDFLQTLRQAGTAEDDKSVYQVSWHELATALSWESPRFWDCIQRFTRNRWIAVGNNITGYRVRSKVGILPQELGELYQQRRQQAFSQLELLIEFAERRDKAEFIREYFNYAETKQQALDLFSRTKWRPLTPVV